ncbi:MAG TPA: protease modulator HflC [Alphaproteobacteria bacterium]|jgi:Membrane protease subunits, stomatin/prohibitin homologs|nr:MAG: protease modulator HflC [SAR116 cluster bacterium]HBQ23148.1 protease modulator HflC [Alphaproteobacteria bacterium]HCJ61917.1 protease modulator HflC [Alphaproteobacteria bacterium]HCY48291.1 protease modulator HflC [Alphaproteobacteria bacterium]|tara:strand:- start:5043 stop:5924 length:882 start_codon:yes stop_codon:yes gene_type:complete
MRGIIALVVAVVLVIIALSSVFTVRETEQALVIRFGRVVADPVTQPGLHFKMPIVDEVVYVDRRLLSVTTQEEEVITEDQKRLVLDAFARYKISNSLKFFQTVKTDFAAESRMSTILNSALRRVIGTQQMDDVLSGERANLMVAIRDAVNREAEILGLDVVDVRIRRVDLPENISQSIFRRMQTERQQEAQRFRSEGNEQSRRIRSVADRQVVELLAEANKQAEIIKGEGDGERNRIFASSFGQDPDFFAFYRSMSAYVQSLGGSNTSMVLSPNSRFFRFFNESEQEREALPK